MTNNQLLYFNRTKLPQKETKQNKIKTHWNASWFCSFTVKKFFFVFFFLNRQTVRFPLTAKQPAKLVFLVSFLRKVKSKGSYYRLTQTYRSAIESSRFTQVRVLFSSGYIFCLLLLTSLLTNLHPITNAAFIRWQNIYSYNEVDRFLH